MNNLQDQVINLILKVEFLTEDEKRYFISHLPKDEKQLKKLKDKLEDTINQFEKDKPMLFNKINKLVSDYKVKLEEYKNKKIREIIAQAEKREREEDLEKMLDNI
jgi:uncharacterized protein YgiM (DUF1202 family)